MPAYVLCSQNNIEQQLKVCSAWCVISLGHDSRTITWIMGDNDGCNTEVMSVWLTGWYSLRRCQVAAESDRKRLLRRCLNDWRVWCRMERERREILQQQEKTKRKMEALIYAAVSGKLGAVQTSVEQVTDHPEKSSQSEPIHIQVSLNTWQADSLPPSQSSSPFLFLFYSLCHSLCLRDWKRMLG